MRLVLLPALVNPRRAFKRYLGERRDDAAARSACRPLTPIDVAVATIEWCALTVGCVALAAWIVGLPVATALRWWPVYGGPVLAWVGLRALGAPWTLPRRRGWATPRVDAFGATRPTVVAATPVREARVLIALLVTAVPPAITLAMAALHSLAPEALGWSVFGPTLAIALAAAWAAALVAHGAVAARTHGTGKRAERRFWLGSLLDGAGLAGLVAVTWLWLLPAVAAVRVVPSSSMYPTIIGGVGDIGASLDPFAPATNDRILVDTKAYAFAAPQRWDVVVFDHPRWDEWLVKRIVGMPGETVEIVDGRVRANGRTARRGDDVITSQALECFRLTAAQMRARLVDEAVGPDEAFAPLWLDEVGGDVALTTAANGDDWLTIGFVGGASGSNGRRAPQTRHIGNDAHALKKMLLGRATTVGLPRLGCTAMFTDPTVLPGAYAGQGLADRHDLIGEAVVRLADDVTVVRLVIESPDGAYVAQLAGPAAPSAESRSIIATADAGTMRVSEGRSTQYRLPANRQLLLRWQNVDEVLRVWVDGWELHDLARTRPGAGDCSREQRPLAAVPPFARYRTVPWISAEGTVALKSWRVLSPTIYINHDSLAEGARLRVPADRYVVLGDLHEAVTDDSRVWELYELDEPFDGQLYVPDRVLFENDLRGRRVPAPFLPRSAIRGRVVAVFAPPEHARPIH